MPNYVMNRIDIKKLYTPAQYAKAIRELTVNGYDNEILVSQYFDFNKLIPEPETKEECPKEFILPDDDTSLSHDDGKTWFDWYNWRIKNWGTKWNVCDAKTIHNMYMHNTSITFIFQTAWSFPAGIVNKLARMGYEFEWTYSDEDRASSNSGIIICEQVGRGEYEIHEEHDTFDEDEAETFWDDCYDFQDGAVYK